MDFQDWTRNALFWLETFKSIRILHRKHSGKQIQEPESAPIDALQWNFCYHRLCLMRITSSRCSAIDLPQSAQTFTLYLPTPFLLPVLNNACAIQNWSRPPSFLLYIHQSQVFLFLLDVSHQLQTCQFSLNPRAGCCWADTTKSPHQTAMTAKNILGNTSTPG